MRPYADTNFFTRCYLELPQSERVATLIEAASLSKAPPFAVTLFHRLELCNAFQLHVFQGRTSGQKWVLPEQAAAALAAFRQDLEQRSFLQAVSIVNADLVRQVEELSLRHTARHGFRTYDAVHVASALLLECDTFWSFDPKASRLAALEGLETL